MIVNDRVRLRQVIVNLLSNALKFTDEGTVTIEVKDTPQESTQGGEIVISVRDTGCGIAVEDQQYIFDAFHQTDQKVTRSHAGTGLGLAITQSIVVMMHGEVAVKSDIGKGSVFTVTLPRVVSADEGDDVIDDVAMAIPAKSH